MSGLYGIGTDLLTLQAAAAAPKLIRASKTFTGAANLGAVGVNELFTTTGAVLLEGFWVRCTTTLEDAVDGALFTVGVTGDDNAFTGSMFQDVFDLDTLVAGSGLSPWGGIQNGWGLSLAVDNDGGNHGPLIILDNIIMTISAQAITGGTLQFFVLYRPLSSDGALTLGTGMVAI